VIRREIFLHAIKRGKANWIGHFLRRNCLLKHVIEGRAEEKRRGGRRLRQLLDDLRGKKGYRKLKRKHYIALYVELALEEAMNLS
jgi:hypothetical protein